MDSEFQERRRSPRIALDGGAELRVSRQVRVRLLDVSEGGALLASEEPLPVGATGRLRLVLGAEPFQTAVEVMREQAAADGRGRAVGVVMVSMEAEQKDALDEFLRRAGS